MGEEGRFQEGLGFLMESVSFYFDGVSTLTARIENAVLATDYTLECFGGDGGSTPVNDVAVTDTLVLTITDISLDAAYTTFEADVYETSTDEYYGSTLFPTDGSRSQYARNASWTYDGASTISVVLQVPVLSVDYYLEADGISGSENTPGTNATDAYQTWTILLAVPPSGRFVVSVYNDVPGPYQPFGIRLFDAGVASNGMLGNPNSSTLYQRIYGWTVNISDDALETVDPVLTSPQGF